MVKLIEEVVIMNDEQDNLFPDIKPPEAKDFTTLFSQEDRPRKANYLDVPPVAARLISPQKWKLWCPYCGRIRQYKKHTYSGTRRCEGCGVSSRDFSVRQVNRLWLSD